MPDPKKPPIVWHLDTDEIGNKTNSPPDRLTMVKILMECYENESCTVKVGRILKEIRSVCKKNSSYTEDDLINFLEASCPDYEIEGDSETKKGA